MATRKGPLRGRALWETCVHTVEERLAEHGGDRQGHINHFHFRLGRPKSEAIDHYELDTQLLQAYKALAAAGRKPRRRKHVTPGTV